VRHILSEGLHRRKMTAYFHLDGAFAQFEGLIP